MAQNGKLLTTRYEQRDGRPRGPVNSDIPHYKSGALSPLIKVKRSQNAYNKNSAHPRAREACLAASLRQLLLVAAI
jgi:hypothetical protein